MIKEFLSQNKLKIKILAKKLSVGLGSAILVALFSILVANLFYHNKKPEKRGFVVEIKPQNESINNAGVKKSAELSSKSSKSIDIATLIKNADLKAGERVFKKCKACHAVQKDGKNKIGPNLYNIVGAKKAAVSGFSYSSALKAKGGSWTIKDLDLWLENPREFASGTKMTFAGLKKQKDRANVIAYIKQQN
jgi:cytochrome c